MEPRRPPGPAEAQVREPADCPHRESSSKDGSPACCRLAAEIAGTDPQGVPVGVDACRACCRRPIPNLGRINPVVASLVSRTLSEAKRRGTPGASPERAALILRWVSRELAVQPRPGAEPTPRDPKPEPTPALPIATPSWPVAVVLPGGIDARVLASLLARVREQTRAPTEVLVVGPHPGVGSTPEGLRYVRPREGEADALANQRAAVEAAEADILWFLEPGDEPAVDYLERGVPLFADPTVGVVYSDWEHGGPLMGRSFAPEFEPRTVDRRPWIVHRGSLVRRSAVLTANACRAANVPLTSADRVIWRRVFDQGWKGVRQPSRFRAATDEPSQGWPDFYDSAALGAADVTIFTPLAGRASAWEAYARWLKDQQWPRDQCRLLLSDTSGASAFSRTVRDFLASCDYPDVRYSARPVGAPGLADRPRGEHLAEVRRACSRIYAGLAVEVATPFVLIVEDDVIPPTDVIEALLRCLDPGTDAVAAPYRARQHPAYVVWDHEEVNLGGGRGVQEVGGSGFGCLLLRRDVLEELRPPGPDDPPDIDRTFGRRLRRGLRSYKVDWSRECQHLAVPSDSQPSATVEVQA